MLDTNTYDRFVGRGRFKIDDMVLRMAEVAARHSIGVLVIDEIQNLRKARGNGASDVLDYLLYLDNKLGIPVVLVGTPKALPVLTGEFRRARRAAGQEAIAWNRMREDERDWQLFTKTLWSYQYVTTNCPLTPELRHALYHESQGIIDIAVKVYMLAQIEAITRRKEIITEESLISASHTRLSFVQPFLADIRNNVAPDKIEDPGDLSSLDLEKIVQEAIERYHQDAPYTVEEELPQEQSDASKEQGQTQKPASQESAPSQPPTGRRSRKQEDADSVHLAIPRAVAAGKRQDVAPYAALKTGGYIKPATQYLLREPRSSDSSSEEST